ncbi:MAG TPA: hypothetical protein VFT55_06170, partial [Planctomycetota bacterium]|nr:hypothetical protein [Planctomycetota bacterium]
MNLGLYRSWHALVALGVAAAFWLWHWLVPAEFGSRADSNVAFLLTTGWIAVACYVVLALYAVRRAVHRLRLSPEFGWKVKLPQLEQAQSYLVELQNRILRREVVGTKAVRSEVAAILRAFGVRRVLRVEIERDPAGLGMLRLRVGPREPLGRLASWLHAHVFYGLAAAILVFFHGGLRSESTMGFLLNGLSYFVIGSGVLGALLWTFGPTWLTRAEREMSIEKAFALARHYDACVAEAATTRSAATGVAVEKASRELATLVGQRHEVQTELRRLGRFRE